jgi:hypothetical protein
LGISVSVPVEAGADVTGDQLHLLGRALGGDLQARERRRV